MFEGADDRDPSHQDQGFSLREWLDFRDAKGEREILSLERSFF